MTEMDQPRTGVPWRSRFRAASVFLLGVLLLLCMQIAVQTTLELREVEDRQQRDIQELTERQCRILVKLDTPAAELAELGCAPAGPQPTAETAFYRTEDAAIPLQATTAGSVGSSDWGAYTLTFVQLGVGGVMLLLFIQGRIVPRNVVESKDRDLLALTEENRRLLDLVGDRHLKVIDEKFIPLVQQMVVVSEQSTQSVTALKAAVELLGDRIESIEDKPPATSRSGRT